jgi:tetratricopeptide (TPR) repeat protein
MITASLTSTARAHAAAGAWAELCALLRASPDETKASPELTNLYAESLLRTGDLATASRVVDDALLNLRRHGDRPALRRAVNLAGAAYFELGQFDDAEAAFEHAVELAGYDGDDLLMARAANNLALIATIRRRYEDALGRYRMAIPAYQRLGNVLGLAESYHNMAIAYRDQHALDLADEHERRAIEFARQAGNARAAASAMVGRAEIALRRGDCPVAERTAAHAANEFQAMSDPARRADALRVCGAARATLGKTTEAAASIDEAMALARGCGAASIEAECLWSRAELAYKTGERDLALADVRAALAIFIRLSSDRDRVALETWMRDHGFDVPEPNA